MRAAVYEEFCGPVEVRQVDDPTPAAHGAVLRVEATGVCRSDWHGWMGHDKDISVPHVPGHELAGTIEALGSEVCGWSTGARVTVPFVCGCGSCPQCESGNHQVCDNQTQPGFTHWGSYAEYVSIDYADVNLVALPDEIDFETAASLGCRFATSFRGVVAQGNVQPGQWVAIYGCGGVGLSAVMIAVAVGARVIAVDIDPQALRLAADLGAEVGIDATASTSVVEAVQSASAGGAHLTVDALGSRATAIDAVASLRKRGRHVQIGLLAGDDFRPPLPMELVIANELEIVGSHGMQAVEYGRMLEMIRDGRLAPEKLIGQSVDLDTAAAALGDPSSIQVPGVTVINKFEA